MRKIATIAILLFLSSTSNAGFISYTGKYKIHDDKCYRQVIRYPSEILDWEEFDCVAYLEDMHINEAILNYVKVYYYLMRSGQVSEKAYKDILDACMSASQRSHFKETILPDLLDVIKEAQEKYPVK
jgi:hypothetical protein